MIVHTPFDLLAACTALAMTMTVYRWRLPEAGQRSESAGTEAADGSPSDEGQRVTDAGTLNLWLSCAP